MIFRSNRGIDDDSGTPQETQHEHRLGQPVESGPACQSIWYLVIGKNNAYKVSKGDSTFLLGGFS